MGILTLPSRIKPQDFSPGRRVKQPISVQRGLTALVCHRSSHGSLSGSQQQIIKRDAASLAWIPDWTGTGRSGKAVAEYHWQEKSERSWSPSHSAAPATEPETVDFIRKVLSFIVNTTRSAWCGGSGVPTASSAGGNFHYQHSAAKSLCFAWTTGKVGNLHRAAANEEKQISEINRRHKKQLHKSRVSVFPFALCFLIILHPNRGA